MGVGNPDEGSEGESTMRYSSFLVGVFLFAAFHTNAQINATNTESASPSFAFLSETTPNPSSVVAATPTTVTPASLALSPATTPDPPQSVQGVFENYSWQAYIGYTFFRFYEVPAITQNTNGFSYGIVYYLKDWFGVDGEFDATHLNQYGTSGWFLYGAGGPRFRWSAPHNLEVWGHVLGGWSHFNPQTAFGTRHAPGFETGCGLDINIHHRRLAYRIEGDMIGTRFFNTYQYSPKVSTGIVFKF
jgi:hypothetical protein